MQGRNINIAINGFGRIGRIVARIINETQENFKIACINGTMSPQSCAHLIKFDSIYGILEKDIQFDENSIQIGNSNKIEITNDLSLNSLNWRDKKIDLVIESSGKYKDTASLRKHIYAGAKKVIVTSPVSDSESTIVYGVNEENYSNDFDIISTSSCTTNCAAPLLKMIDSKFYINFASLTTIHAYTNDQKLLDANHKDLRRSRSAPRSMIPTTTGSSKEIVKLIPKFKNKIICNAIRVPLDSVSLLDLTFNSSVIFTEKELKEYIVGHCDGSTMPIDCTSLPLVSVDFIKNKNSAIVDLNEVRNIDNQSARILAWYDNEYGFACRVVDLINLIYKNWQ